MKRLLNVMFFAIWLLLAAGLRSETALPKQWEPDLDRAIEAIEKELEEATAQMVMNDLSATLSQLKDARLALVYLQLYGALPEKERTLLKSEQQKWLRKREAAVHAVSPDPDERGSITPLEENLAAIKETEIRTKELGERLNKLE